MKSIFIVDSICFFIVIIGFISLLIVLRKSSDNSNKPIKKEDKDMHFACLIPARDESLIIRGLFESIKNQTMRPNMEDVYVIVESKADKTVSYAKEYGISVIVRENLNLRRKGYALDEAIKKILSSKKKYDCYFIIDADNILDRNFFYEMNKSYKEGYDIVTGYRNTKNGNVNVVAASSTLTFSMINTVGNILSNRTSGNITISGTGFFIRGKFIEKWGGYPFHSLTEDYELTLYSVVNEMNSFYNVDACFYDEQPVTFKQSFKQRVRWIRGYFEARKLYIKELRKKKKERKTIKNYGSVYSKVVGVIPYIIIVIGLVLNIILLFVNLLFNNNLFFETVLNLLCIFVFIYFLIMLFTCYMLKLEGSKLNLKKDMKLKAVLFNPFFLMTYVLCALKALFTKEIMWDKIEHKENKITR